MVTVAPAGRGANESSAFVAPNRTAIDIGPAGREMTLVLPSKEVARGDEVLAEVYSWDKDGDKTLSFAEVSEAAAALRRAKLRERSWQRRFAVLGLMAALLVGVLAGVLIGANEANKRVSADSNGVLLSRSGQALSVEVASGRAPTLFDLPELDDEDLAAFDELVLPLSADEESDDGLHARVNAAFRRGSTVTLWLSGGHRLTVGEAEATLQLGSLGALYNGSSAEAVQNTVVYRKGPLAADGTFDIIVADRAAPDPSEIVPGLADVNAAGGGRLRRLRRAVAPVRGHTVSVLSLWHGDHGGAAVADFADEEDEREHAEWHAQHNRHWRRRGFLVHPTLGQIHFPGGFRDAVLHPSPAVRALARPRLGALQQAGAEAGAGFVFTRAPVQLEAARWTTSGSFRNVGELPGMPAFTRRKCYRIAERFDFGGSVKAGKKICKKLWKTDFKAGRKACKALQSGEDRATAFEFLRCNLDLDLAVCDKICGAHATAATGGAAACREACREQEDPVKYGRIKYALDLTAAGVYPFVPDGLVRCGNPKSLSELGIKTEECDPTVVPPDGIARNELVKSAEFLLNVSTQAWIKFDKPRECLHGCENKVWYRERETRENPDGSKSFFFNDVFLNAKQMTACQDRCYGFFAQRTGCLVSCASSTAERPELLRCARACELETCKAVKFWRSNFARPDFYRHHDYTRDRDFNAAAALSGANQACLYLQQDLTNVLGVVRKQSSEQGVPLPACEKEVLLSGRTNLRGYLDALNERIANVGLRRAFLARRVKRFADEMRSARRRCGCLFAEWKRWVRLRSLYQRVAGKMRFGVSSRTRGRLRAMRLRLRVLLAAMARKRSICRCRWPRSSEASFRNHALAIASLRRARELEARLRKLAEISPEQVELEKDFYYTLSSAYDR